MVELQTIQVGVSNMELASTPGSISNAGSIAKCAAFVELFVEPVNIQDNETIRGSVVGIIPFLCVVPLQVELYAIPLHTGIFRLAW